MVSKVKQKLTELKAAAKENRLNVVYMVLLFINYFSYVREVSTFQTQKSLTLIPNIFPF